MTKSHTGIQKILTASVIAAAVLSLAGCSPPDYSRPDNLLNSEVNGCFADDKAYFNRAKGPKLTVLVHKDILINRPFDVSVKARFVRAAEAVEYAVARQKRYIPSEATWGSKL